MIKTLVLTKGYAETTSIPIIIATHRTGFLSIGSALLSLGTIIVDSINEYHDPELNICCDKTSNFCPECGKRQFVTLSSWEIEHSMLDIWCTYDGNSHFLDSCEFGGWKLWMENNPFKNPAEVALINQNACKWLMRAAGVDPEIELSHSDIEMLDGSDFETGYVEDGH